MGKYKGFTCDSCGEVLDENTRTKKRTSFEGSVADGSYVEDLCETCTVVPEGVNFRPTKRRGPRTAVAGTEVLPEEVPQAPPDPAVPAGVGG